MQTNFNVTNDAALKLAGDQLLAAAMAYWSAYQRAVGFDAVVWLQDTDGQLVIFTRGEYRQRLMANIEHVRQDIEFG